MRRERRREVCGDSPGTEALSLNCLEFALIRYGKHTDVGMAVTKTEVFILVEP